MTTVISRLFPDEASAHDAVDRLQFKGVPARECDVFVAGVDAARLERAMVNDDATSHYVSALNGGQALVVVRTTYRPLGAAKLTREVLAARGGVETPGVTEDYFVPGTTFHDSKSILKDHPRVLSSPYELKFRGPVTSNFGLPMLKAHRQKRSVISGGRYMSRAFWPMKLVSQKSRKKSVISGGRYMSKAFWPRPLLSTKPRRKSVIPGGGTPFSRLFGLKTVS
ncbi:hypothetical protein [Yoonia sp. SS1-5]|uniref:Uncharacterized protein n=1 Tax=Yoonia rhodophyticola TaxID=3137370 RepID=A0AAN0MAG5_9RHOB